MDGRRVRPAGLGRSAVECLGAVGLALFGGFARAEEPPHTAAAMLQVVPPEQRLTLTGVVMHARLEIRIVLIGLLVATVAAIVVWAVQQLRDGPSSRARGLAFLSTLVVTAPLLGLTIAAYDLLKICLGLANFRPTPDLVMIAPALAEGAMAGFLGLLTASVAAALRGHLLVAGARPSSGSAPQIRP